MIVDAVDKALSYPLPSSPRWLSNPLHQSGTAVLNRIQQRQSLEKERGLTALLRTALLHRTVGTAYERAAYRPNIHTETTTTGSKIEEYSFRSEDAACSRATYLGRYSQSEEYNKICRVKRESESPASLSA